jgi:pyruvate carboxylase
LELFGDKTRARALAEQCAIGLLKGSATAVSLDQAKAFFESLAPRGAMIIKAVAGGGGRGMRVVRSLQELPSAYARCQSEALQAFGNGALFVEQLMLCARHIEVQIIGDASGQVIHLGERECSIQRRHQKLIEIAPCPSLSAELQARITADAVRLAQAARFLNAGTVEFLVNTRAMGSATIGDADYAFIEVNPRLQVEHTVTEEVLGIDLVRIQLELAQGRTLSELALEQTELSHPRGYAIQMRINPETMAADGVTRPTSGTLVAWELPSGQGVRVDTAVTLGYQTNPHFDSLFAKVICHATSPRFSDTVVRAGRALGELQVEGIATNQQFIARILGHPDFVANRIDTGFIDNHLAEFIAPEASDGREVPMAPSGSKPAIGAAVDRTDPLAVLA